MSDTYVCCHCKRQYIGAPAMTNGAGSFCVGCKSDMLRKASEAPRERSAMLNGRCMWCGENITDGSGHRRPGYIDNVCRTCCSHRDWLLRCIKFSDHPAKYVASKEDKERAERLLRKAEERAAAEQPKLALAPAKVAAESSTEARIDSLEAKVDKLLAAWGV